MTTHTPSCHTTRHGVHLVTVIVYRSGFCWELTNPRGKRLADSTSDGEYGCFATYLGAYNDTVRVSDQIKQRVV